MISKVSRNDTRQKRHLRVRMNISGTSTLPRLNVFRSNKHIYAQIIDDVLGTTLVCASSNDKELKLENGSNCEAAKQVGAFPGQGRRPRGNRGRKKVPVPTCQVT